MCFEAELGCSEVCCHVQEKDLRLVPDESDEKDISVYLGLAAAAFLLVMLYPSDNTSEHDISMRPANQLPPAGMAHEPASRKGSGRLRLPQNATTPFANDADTGPGTLGLSSSL